MSVVRWVFVDEDTDDTVTLSINPSSMDAFPRSRILTSAYPARNNQDRQRTFRSPQAPGTYSWAGSIRTQAQYETLRTWVRLSGVIEVTDHLGRVFRVVMQSFKPDRKHRRPGDYRMQFTLVVQWIERVS